MLQKRKLTDLIVIHCADTPASMDIGVKEIDRWHREKGWTMVGYHFVIRRNGKIEEGRPVDTIGAHVSGHNATSVGICLVGGKGGEDNFTDEQFDTLSVVLRDLRNKYPKAFIKGHRDLNPGKLCPSFDIAQFLRDRGIS